MGLPGLDASRVPADSQLHRSQRYLASAYDSVASLIVTTYPALRATRAAGRGRLTHAEQDVFRAAVVFAGAGLDAVFKEALRSCLSVQIDRSEGAREKYLDFVERQIQSGGGIDARQIASLLVSSDPDRVLKDAYVEKLTGVSLQSRTQVTNSLSALGLNNVKDLYTSAKSLDALFRVRNEIAHELDMTPASAAGRGARSRRERSITVYEDLCHSGLNYAQAVLNVLADSLHTP